MFSNADDIGGPDVIAVDVLLGCVVEVHLQRREGEVVAVASLRQSGTAPRHEEGRERRKQFAHL